MEMVTTRITDALPITRPSAVRKLRNLLARSACRLNRSASPKYIRRRKLPAAVPRLVDAPDRWASDRFGGIDSGEPWLDPGCASAQCTFAREQNAPGVSSAPAVRLGRRQLHFPVSAPARPGTEPDPARGPLGAAPHRWHGEA